MMAWATLGLAVLTAVLGGPVPILLARARWPARAPRAAVVLWQAIGLTAALSAISAGLGAAVAPLAATLPHGVHVLLAQLLTSRLPPEFSWQHYLALCWAVGFTGFLAWRCGRAIESTLRQRRRHRGVVDLVSESAADLGPDVGVLRHDAPVAYCVPGRRSLIIVSTGTLDILDDAELGALLAHERAHVRARHDLAVLPFAALARALPWLPIARHARAAAALLVEMLADDSARRVHGDKVLARALVQMAAHKTHVPAGAFGAASAGVLTRIRRLITPVPPIPAWQQCLVYGMAALLLLIPVAVALSPMLRSLS